MLFNSGALSKKRIKMRMLHCSETVKILQHKDHYPRRVESLGVHSLLGAVNIILIKNHSSCFAQNHSSVR